MTNQSRNETQIPDPSDLSREERREKYGTLNPSGTLLTSDELKSELEEIVDDSAADGGRIHSAVGVDYVKVELVFSVAGAGHELGVFDEDGGTDE